MAPSSEYTEEERAEVCAVLYQLYELYCLDCIQKDFGNFKDHLSLRSVLCSRLISDRMNELCEKINPNVLGITEAFGLDEVLKKVPVDDDSVKFNFVDEKTNF